MPQGENSGRFGALHGLAAGLDRGRPAQPLLPLARLALGDRGRTEAAIRALATTVPMADRTLLVRVLGRYKMLLDAGDTTHAPHLALDGFWEWWTTAFLARFLKKGARVIDAGAGYGYFSLLAAELVGPSGRVVAIEPHPRSATLLRRNLALNGFEGRAEVVQAALAGPQAPLALPLLVPPEGPLAAHLAEAAEATGGLTVPVQTLDRFAPLRPELVKLDLAGGEEAAWEGMQRLLAECPGAGLLLSFSPGQCREPEALLQAIAGRFPLRVLTPGGEARETGIAALLASDDAMLWLRR